MTERVAILGCGYVGLELGRQLHDDHEVVGVRRSDSGIAAIEDAGFEAVQADVTDPESLSAVPDADWLVFAASSGGRGAEAAREVYVEGLRTAIDHFWSRADPPERLVYTSSTGVYGDHDGAWVDEETPLDPQTEKTEVLAEAERVARERPTEHGGHGAVARFAGLYGPDRYRLERYLEGPVTAGYLNMVHRADAAGAVRHLLTEDHRDGVVLVVDDEPVEKWAFADWLAEQCEVPFPPKQTTDERLADDSLSETAKRRIQTSKRCSNGRLQELGYTFEYPTFREGYRDAVREYRQN
ncbi:SDR family oxidoreductase [Haloarcula argentinensis]|uniref:NAD(P)-dependent oxidoreductase n=1 Tax=Haloarcula argentinensis TaxID=43776 RepID=A0A830FJC3_HALAR|nr:SDR family oxidoreductase [Haloarcula argentinensis]EMA19290.1 NAD-dependent epimerase/dehydratase [Haloarcula argentinensis DSM 12282]MDS0254217.1 SDR family oxidoreductase [Haloarcula argentinensis]GGM43311.1 NAD(P)-dependent oxidoreductase [Haloarcula argentinensis]